MSRKLFLKIPILFVPFSAKLAQIEAESDMGNYRLTQRLTDTDEQRRIYNIYLQYIDMELRILSRWDFVTH